MNFDAFSLCGRVPGRPCRRTGAAFLLLVLACSFALADGPSGLLTDRGLPPEPFAPQRGDEGELQVRDTVDLRFGLLASEAREQSFREQWNFSIRGSSVRFESGFDVNNLSRLKDLPLVVLEDRCLDSGHLAALEDWVRQGGILLINGITCAADGEVERDRVRAELANLTLLPRDEGMIGVYPRFSTDTPLVGPFESGDGLRLGVPGIGHAYPVTASEEDILARGYRIVMDRNRIVRPSDAVTMTARPIGDGLVLFLNFSLGEITLCYPDQTGDSTDCSGAGTARGLMRNLVSNLLWEVRGLQVPLMWETAGNRPVGVVITGDVHSDEEGFQVKSARHMARSLAAINVPVTYFIVGEVAERFPDHYQALNAYPNVSVNGHSAFGELYSATHFRNQESILKDLRTAESHLGLPSWPGDRRWLRAIRTESWSSNESQVGAWSAMAEAGIALVMDHNADALIPGGSATAPLAWIEGEAHQRLFIPMLESSVHTMSDDFRLDSSLDRRIFSVGSPEPDPCCNDLIRFSTYADYVERWHKQFLKMGTNGGALEVWLWHPSTPVWKGGLDDLTRILGEMASDERVELLFADEVAVWAYNRERMRIRPTWSSGGQLSAAALEVDHDDLVPFPPEISKRTSEATYWVYGEADLPGWSAQQWQDGYGRTVTVLRRRVETSEESR